MAIVKTPGLWWPGSEMNHFALGSQFFTLDAAGEKFAALVRVPKTGTIKSVSFRLSTVTVADALKVSFQDVGDDGDPDGVVDQFRVVPSPTSETTHTTGLMTSDGTDTGDMRSVTEGELLCIVIEFDSYVAGNLQVRCRSGVAATRGGLFTSYCSSFDTSVWTRNSLAIPNILLQYDDDSYSYMPDAFPVDTCNDSTMHSGNTPNEVALRFQVSVACEISGVWLAARFEGAGGMDVVLYDDGGTSLRSVTMDPDARIPGSNIVGIMPRWAPYGLAANTTYRLAIKPLTTTAIRYYWYTVTDAAFWAQFFGGPEWHFSSRTDDGAWTDDTLKRIMASLFISGVDVPAGGGGSRAVIL